MPCTASLRRLHGRRMRRWLALVFQLLCQVGASLDYSGAGQQARACSVVSAQAFCEMARRSSELWAPEAARVFRLVTANGHNGEMNLDHFLACFRGFSE